METNLSYQILTGLDYAAEDPQLSTKQIKSVRVRTNKRGSYDVAIKSNMAADTGSRLAHRFR